MKFSELWRELKDRRVVRVLIGYAVVAAVIVQAADLTLEPLGLPAWAYTFVLVVMIGGFPVAVVLAWAFDVTPDGIERAKGRRGETQRHTRSVGGWRGGPCRPGDRRLATHEWTPRHQSGRRGSGHDRSRSLQGFQLGRDPGGCASRGSPRPIVPSPVWHPPNGRRWGDDLRLARCRRIRRDGPVGRPSRRSGSHSRCRPRHRRVCGGLGTGVHCERPAPSGSGR